MRCFQNIQKLLIMDRWKKLIYNGNPFPDRAVLDKLDVRDENRFGYMTKRSIS